MNIQSLCATGDTDLKKPRFHLGCDLNRNKRPDGMGADPECGGNLSVLWGRVLPMVCRAENILSESKCV